MTNEARYRGIFRDIFGVPDSALNETFTFKDVKAWDSMTHLTLINELETAFDVMFETEDVLHFGGFENGRRILEKYGVDFSA